MAARISRSTRTKETNEIGGRTKKKDKNTRIKCRSPYPFMVESIEMSVIDGRS